MKITKSELQQIIKEEIAAVREQTAKQKAGSLPSGDTGERLMRIDDFGPETYDPMLVVTTKVFKKLREAESLLRDIGTGAQKKDAMQMLSSIMTASKYVARELGRLQAERSEQMGNRASGAPMYGQTKSQDTSWRGGDVDAYRTVDPDLITGDDV